MLEDIQRIQQFITLYLGFKVNLNDPYKTLHFLINFYFYSSFN